MMKDIETIKQNKKGKIHEPECLWIAWIQLDANYQLKVRLAKCRGEKTRTSDLHVPNVAR